MPNQLVKNKSALPERGQLNVKNLSREDDSLSNLPKSIFVKELDPRKNTRDLVNKVFSDGFMIVITLLIIPIVLLPLAIDLTGNKPVLQILDFCDLVITSFFVAEYSLKLYSAKNRWEYFHVGWHLLDLFIVVISIWGIMSIFVFGVTFGVRGSPYLYVRFLRLARVFAIGSRSAASRARLKKGEERITQGTEQVQIRVIEENLETIHDNVPWEQVEEYLTDKNQQWIEISNLNSENIEKLGETLNIPAAQFESRLIDEGFPRIDSLERASLVFLQPGQLFYPGENHPYLTISKTGLLIIYGNNDIVTVTREKLDLFEIVLPNVRKHQAGNPLIIVVLYCILEYIIKRYRSIVSEIEIELMRMERVQTSQMPSDFLDRTFQLKKEVSGLSADLLHTKQILSIMDPRQLPIAGMNDAWAEMFDIFQDQTSYLEEATNNAKENLLSIIDLHINRTSYEVNKVLKVLAVITVLAVIPAFVTGMLGQNIADLTYAHDFTVYLWQVVICVIIGMVCVTYIFGKLGWLKS